MDVQAYKLNLLQRLLAVENESLLRKIDSLLEKEAIVAWTTGGRPLTLTQYNSRLEKGKKQVEAGQTLSTGKVQQKMGEWQEKYKK